jgi:hypothetical protein
MYNSLSSRRSRPQRLLNSLQRQNPIDSTLLFTTVFDNTTNGVATIDDRHTITHIHNATRSDSTPWNTVSRRQALWSAATFAAAATTTGALTAPPAHAGLPEVDSTGQLYTPRPQMLQGGSDAARGIPGTSGSSARLQPGQVLQTVYETRFIAYLSRFLLNFDPSLHAWWIKQGYGDTWEDRGRPYQDPKIAAAAEALFAEFAESVEVGLADYFVGPYGSYSSLAAAKAGLMAAQPAVSQKADAMQRGRSFFQALWKGPEKIATSGSDDSVRLAKLGILNLYTLLKARYDSLNAKKQSAILFSFISSPRLQPTREISSLLGEADNATVARIEVIVDGPKENEATSRTSSRRGGGYSLSDIPRVTIETPPALGDDFRAAQAIPLLRPTTRVLLIVVTDGGEGYTSAPQVSIIQSGYSRACQAVAILDREGHVESVLVLDPGYGYGGRTGVPPQIQIDAPLTTPSSQRTKNAASPVRRAQAVAEMEYEVYGVQMLRGGNGYVASEPPVVTLTPPMDDPDWYLDIQEQPQMRILTAGTKKRDRMRLEVTEMTYADGNVAYTTKGLAKGAALDDVLIERLQRDPLLLLPSSLRPERKLTTLTQQPFYIIPSLAAIPQFVAVLSPRYRATDPVFGSVGRVPVTKGALALSASEYGRLALSGAVCTVLVRTALNPLELIKTKQQLQNDVELLEYTRKRMLQKASSALVSPVSTTPPPLSPSTIPPSTPPTPPSLETNHHAHSETLSRATTASPVAPRGESVAVLEATVAPPIAEETVSVPTTKVKMGTLDVVGSMVELRGPLSLFQSADITFLASLVFGSLGFGATELFRRSFALNFLGSEGVDQQGSEIVLLLAAAVATLITAAAAAPFEVLRVRSMGLLEAQPWTEVLRQFIVRIYCVTHLNEFH